MSRFFPFIFPREESTKVQSGKETKNTDDAGFFRAVGIFTSSGDIYTSKVANQFQTTAWRTSFSAGAAAG